MEKEENSFQNMIIDYVDQVKELLSPTVWQNVLLNCSKNELFVMWLLYRNTEVNMTQIAEYIHVPLNTATGIISRMEKRRMVLRKHSELDKRVVTIALTDEGSKQLQKIISEVSFYAQNIFQVLTDEERDLLLSIMDKIAVALKTKPQTKEDLSGAPIEIKKVKKIIIE